MNKNKHKIEKTFLFKLLVFYISNQTKFVLKQYYSIKMNYKIILKLY